MTEVTAPGGGGEAPDSPGLRAYLPDRRFAAALCTGSAVLVGKGWGWITADGPKTAGARLGYTALGGYVGAYVVDAYTPVAMPALVVGWGVAALMHSRPSPPPAGGRPRVSLTKSAPANGDEVLDEEDQEPEEETPAPDRATVVALVRRVAEDRQGAHLAQLVETGELGDWDQADLKAALCAWGLPVEEFKLRFGGRQRVREGVRVRHLPRPAGEAPANPPPTPAAGPAVAPPEGLPSGPLEVPPAPSPPPALQGLSGAPVGR
ncbi:hypothetical protein [Streptomyces sp. HJ7]